MELIHSHYKTRQIMKQNICCCFLEDLKGFVTQFSKHLNSSFVWESLPLNQTFFFISSHEEQHENIFSDKIFTFKCDWIHLKILIRIKQLFVFLVRLNDMHWKLTGCNFTWVVPNIYEIWNNPENVSKYSFMKANIFIYFRKKLDLVLN